MRWHALPFPDDFAVLSEIDCVTLYPSLLQVLDIVQQSLNRQIFSLAIPTIVGFLGIILFEAIDIFWIGKLGPNAVAAVGGASFLLWTLYALMNLTNTGTATLIAQFWGAGDREARHQVAREAFCYVQLFSLITIWPLPSRRRRGTRRTSPSGRAPAPWSA